MFSLCNKRICCDTYLRHYCHSVCGGGVMGDKLNWNTRPREDELQAEIAELKDQILAMRSCRNCKYQLLMQGCSIGYCHDYDKWEMEACDER